MEGIPTIDLTAFSPGVVAFSLGALVMFEKTMAALSEKWPALKAFTFDTWRIAAGAAFFGGIVSYLLGI